MIGDMGEWPLALCVVDSLVGSVMSPTPHWAPRLSTIVASHHTCRFPTRFSLLPSTVAHGGDRVDQIATSGKEEENSWQLVPRPSVGILTPEQILGPRGRRPPGT